MASNGSLTLCPLTKTTNNKLSKIIIFLTDIKVLRLLIQSSKMSLIAVLNPEPCQHLTRERLATSSLKVISQYVPVEKEITVHEEARMTVGKAIEEGLVDEKDYLQTCDTELIIVKIPKKLRTTVGFQEYRKVVRAVGFHQSSSSSSSAGVSDDDGDNNNDEVKGKVVYHTNKEKMQDRPYELAFAANNSKSLLESIELVSGTEKSQSAFGQMTKGTDGLSMWSWLTKQLPFELTSDPVQKVYAIVNLKLVVPDVVTVPNIPDVFDGITKNKNKNKSNKISSSRIEVSVAGRKLVNNVYCGDDKLAENPLGHMTILGTVGKNQLLVVNNDDKKKKKYVIDRPQSAFMPPSVEIKYVFLVQKQQGDVFHCLYLTSNGEEFSCDLSIPFDIQRKGVIRDFVLWLPDSVSVVSQ
jgi:hypothetical protein